MTTLTTRRVHARHLEAGDVLLGTDQCPDMYSSGTRILGVEPFGGWMLVHTEAATIDLNSESLVHVSDNCMVRLAAFDEIRPGDEIADLADINGPYRTVMRVNSGRLIVHACPRGACTCAPMRALAVTVVFRDNRLLRLRVR